MILIIDTSQFTVNVVKRDPNRLAFKLLGVSDNMKDYIRFLRWHHGYNDKKLLDAFPEHVEFIKPAKNTQWLVV